MVQTAAVGDGEAAEAVINGVDRFGQLFVFAHLGEKMVLAAALSQVTEPDAEHSDRLLKVKPVENRNGRPVNFVTLTEVVVAGLLGGECFETAVTDGQGDGTTGDTVTSGTTPNHFGQAEQPTADFIVTVDIMGKGGAVADGLDCFVTTCRDDRAVVDAEPHPL